MLRTSPTETSLVIIMIEDDEGHARLIEKNIRRAGITNKIVAFRFGAEAIAWLTSGALDNVSGLMLLDLNLPDMSGLEILARVKEHPHLRRLPVIVLTTTDDQAEMDRCYDLGCNVYVTKPLEYEAFALAIRKLGIFFDVIAVSSIEGEASGDRPGQGDA